MILGLKTALVAGYVGIALITMHEYHRGLPAAVGYPGEEVADAIMSFAAGVVWPITLIYLLRCKR